jgi:hypothetical protein
LPCCELEPQGDTQDKHVSNKTLSALLSTSALQTQPGTEPNPLFFKELGNLLSSVSTKVCTKDQPEANSELIESLAATLLDSLHERELRLLVELLK